MDNWLREDLAYDWNAREDYLAELRAEHADPCWDCDPLDVPGVEAPTDEQVFLLMQDIEF
mgnify:CR=1 FL=1